MDGLVTIHVYLCDEGTDVWRPVPAIKIDDGDLFVILHPPNYKQLEEVWEFPPGSIVRCKSKVLSGNAGEPVERMVALQLQPIPPV